MGEDTGSKPSPAARRVGDILRALMAVVSIVAAPAALFAAPHTQRKGPDAMDDRLLADLSLEELMQVEVTLVSRIPERRFDTPAALFVLTQEDIRRSGASSLPEVLRLVPGVHVARIDANTWAISTRGFNGQFSRKLLVLIDGRSVYSPVFTGVYWDVQDPPLEEIERIEVVRGPGGTLWGANAVNGIINVITKSSWETEGSLLSLNGGVEETGAATLRYGGRAGERTAYRVYGRAAEHDGFAGAGYDSWRIAQGGFRVDWQVENGGFTLLGGAYDGTSGELRHAPSLAEAGSSGQGVRTLVEGGHLVARWSQTLAGGRDLRFQLYVDRERRHDDVGAGRDVGFTEEVDTVDADFQLHLPADGRHHLTLGAGYRLVGDRLTGTAGGSFRPAERTYDLLSGFLEDRIALVDSRLDMVVGARLEYNDFTAFELQPAVRFVWTPRERESLWVAASRAVRTPSRAETNVLWDLATAPGAAPAGVLRLTGNPDLEAEELTALELGYRVQPTDRLVFDLALFHHRYDALITTVPGAPFVESPGDDPRVVVPLTLENGPGAQTHGVELEARWQPSSRWQLDLAYTAVSEEITPLDATGSPPQQATLRSLLDLSRSLELDVTTSWTDRLPDLGVDSFLRLDVRLGWQPRQWLETAVGVRNLGGSHPEFVGGLSGTIAVDVEPQAYVRATMRW